MYGCILADRLELIDDLFLLYRINEVTIMANTFNRKKTYFHVAGILAFMFLFGLIPPFGPLTPMGMQVLGIFIGMIWGWTIGETIWPSLLGLQTLHYSRYCSLYCSAMGLQLVVYWNWLQNGFCLVSLRKKDRTGCYLLSV